MPSRRASEARPVRSLLKDFSRNLIFFSMLSFSSEKIRSVISLMSASHDRPYGFAAYDGLDVAFFCDVEHPDGNVVFPTKGYGGCIHYFKVFCQGLGVTDLFVHLCVRMLHGVLVIDPVDLGGLENHLGLDFSRSKGRRRVCREVGIPGARREDDHPSLFQVAGGSSADEGLGHFPHLDGGLDPASHPEPLEDALDGQTVDDRCKHAHVVGLGALHAPGAPLDTAEDVTPADDDADLDT